MTDSPDSRGTLRGLSPTVVTVNVILHVLLLAGAAAAWAAGSLGAAVTVGLLLTAYTLGLRHAFDPDHIAAIDNTTRALQDSRRTPQTVGMFFALGHSTVVVAAAALVAVSVEWAGLTEDSPVRQALGVWGAAFSGVMLLVLAVINLVTLRSLVLRVRRRPDGVAGADAAGGAGGTGDGPGRPTGALTRLLGPALRRVTRPWHMYPVGLLFGLGFDTATEVSLLILAAGGAASGTPWWVTMLLPLAFTAGMSLMDSADGVFMSRAYRWALTDPANTLRYNITMTSVSVLFAVIVGVLELLALAGDLGVDALAWAGEVPMDNAGFIVLGLFVLIFAAAVLLWRRRAHHR